MSAYLKHHKLFHSVFNKSGATEKKNTAMFFRGDGLDLGSDFPSSASFEGCG